MNNNKLIYKNNKVLLNKEEIKYLNDKVLFNYKEENISYVKSYLKIKNYNYDLNSLKDKLRSLNLNKEVNNTVDAIKLINKICLFEYLGLKNTKNENEKLNIPLYVESYLIDIANIKIEEAKELNSAFENNDNAYSIQSAENSNVYEVFKYVESTYYIRYSPKEKEYYIAIYLNEDKLITYRFIEVYSILANKTLKDSVIELIELLNIKITSIKYYLDICYNNLEILESEDLIKYKSFYKISKKHIYILSKIINYAIKDCYFKTNSKALNYVYLSNRYLSLEVGKAHNTLVPYINTFALMGFYKKDKTGSFREYNDTTVYHINLINEEILEEADLIAQKMIKNKITFSKMNYKYVKKNYDEDIVNDTFLDKNIKMKGNEICA